VIGALPEKTAEEVQQETVRNLKASRKPKDNLTVAERRVLRAFRTNEELTVLSADKSNATMLLETADYNWMIDTLLEDHAYRKSKKGPAESVDRKTVLLPKQSSISEEVCQQLRPQGYRPPRLYGLPKIHKQGASLRPTVSTTGPPPTAWPNTWQAYSALILAALHTM
jgi:hypothetical protein